MNTIPNMPSTEGLSAAAARALSAWNGSSTTSHARTEGITSRIIGSHMARLTGRRAYDIDVVGAAIRELIAAGLIEKTPQSNYRPTR